MKNCLKIGCIAIALSVIPGSFVFADNPPAAAATKATVDPQALTALRNMGSYLRTLSHFSITADSTTDTVDDAGQGLQFAHHTEMQAVRPDKIHVSVRGDEGTRSMFYDGKTFTLYGTQNNFYATVPAPPTITELVRKLHENYDLDAPLADLFYWGTDQDRSSELTSATNLGDERLGGQTCTHYAFRQPDVDWQLWIRTGAAPLPCKIVITDTSDAARPQHATVLQWETREAASASTFHFVPPKGAKRITLRQQDASQPAAAGSN